MSTSSLDGSWSTLFEALEFVSQTFDRWTRQGRLTAEEGRALELALREHATALRQRADAGDAAPRLRGFLPSVSPETSATRAYRGWRAVEQSVAWFRSTDRISLLQSHALLRESGEFLAKIRRQLAEEGTLPAVQAADADLAGSSTPPATQPTSAPQRGASSFVPPPPPRRSAPSSPFIPPPMPVMGARAASGGTIQGAAPPPAAPARPRRNLLEILLDPRSIQWLLGLGGALMAVGLVILLWVNEFFTPPVMAIALGAVNLAVLLAGWWTIRNTRYETMGRGLTLLACLVMPLNLWYYHSHNLLTIDGHLWVAAVVVSVLYAASAYLLRDTLFVYVFCAGVAMTGLLFLADLPPSPQKFLEIASPSTLLVVLGILAIGVERAFAPGEGPFTRQKFGLAFFHSGYALLLMGLLLLFVAHLAGDWLYEIWFKQLYESMHATPSPVCGELRWLAMLLVVAGAAAYIYSDLVVVRGAKFLVLTASTLIWAEVLLVEMFQVQLRMDALIVISAITSLAVNLAWSRLPADHAAGRPLPILGLALGLLPLALGGMVFFQHLGPRSVWADAPPRWSYVGAMVLTALAMRAGAHLYRHSTRWISVAYFFASAAATILAGVALLAAMGLERWQEHAPWLMLLPIAYLVAARLYRGHTAEQPLVWVAHAATGLMLVTSLVSTFEGFTHLREKVPLNLALAVFFAEAAVFYVLATVWRGQAACVHLATAMAAAAVWQLLTWFGVAAETYALAFAIVGVLLLAGYRLRAWECPAPGLAEAAFDSANTLLSLAFVSSVFIGLSRLLSREPQWGFVGTCAFLAVLSLAAVRLVEHGGWRRWYVVTSVAQGLLIVLALRHLIDLSPWQQVQLFSVVVGLILLAVGHLGWYREQDRQSDMGPTSLFFGSLLACVPMAIATWIDRGHGQFHLLNEFGFFAIGALLLVTGLMFQLKSTTLVGGTTTALYFATLLIFVPWGRMNAVAGVILAGGSTLFVLGMVLAFFRDRLLTLPDQIKQRRGLFKVLNWR